MSETEKYCTNCKRNVAEQNFILHTTYCERNIQVCDRCKEPVPHSEMKEHLEEYHVTVCCEKCDMRMERWQLEDHESECIRRPESCQYCELSVPYDELKGHEAYCGARSEKCPNCKQYVQNKDKRYHYLMCEESQQKKKVNSEVAESCSSMTKSDVYKAHQSGCRVNQSFMNFQIHNSLSSSSSDEDISDNEKSRKASCSSNFSAERYNKATNTRHEDQSKLLQQLSLKDNKGYRGNDKQSMHQCINCSDYFVPLQNGCLPICGSCSTFCGHQYTQGIGRGTSINFSGKRNDYNGESTKPSFADAAKVRHEKQTLYTYRGEKTSVASKSEKRCSEEEMKKYEEIACTKGWSYLVQSALDEESKISSEVLSFEPLCMSCEKRFPVFEIDAHMATCVQREEPCHLCAKTVRVIDMRKHLEDCSKIFEAKIRSSQSSGNKICEVQPVSVLTNLSKKQRRKVKKEIRKEEKKKASVTSQPKVSAVQPSLSLYDSVYAHEPHGAVSARRVVEEEEVQIPCEFCNEPINASDLVLHQSGCRPELLHFPREDGSKKIRTSVSSKLEQEQGDFGSDLDENACYATAASVASEQNKRNEQRIANLSHQNNGINTGKTVPAAENGADEHSLPTKTNRCAEGFANQNTKVSQHYGASEAGTESAAKPKVTVVHTRIDLKTKMPISITKEVDATKAILMRGRGKARFPESRSSSVYQDSRPGEFLHNISPQTDIKVVAPSTSRCTEGKTTFASKPEPGANFLKKPYSASPCRNAALGGSRTDVMSDSRTDMRNDAADNNVFKPDSRNAFLAKEPDKIIKVNLCASDIVKNICKEPENVHIMKGAAKNIIVGVSAQCGRQIEIAGSPTVPSASQKQNRKRVADSDISLRRPFPRDQHKKEEDDGHTDDDDGHTHNRISKIRTIFCKLFSYSTIFCLIIFAYVLIPFCCILDSLELLVLLAIIFDIGIF